MDILNKSLQELSFSDIEAFLKQGYPEGTQIEYKREIPQKSLSKSIAAFANTRGGIILIGVEEDRDTGVPIKWEGIPNEDRIRERISQFIANVEPLPAYDIRIIEVTGERVVVLVRILEGDRTPYYVQNDANLWVRTENIRIPVDNASPDAAELLFLRKEKAEKARQNNIIRANVVYKYALERAENERKRQVEEKKKKEENQLTIYDKKLGTDCSLCKIRLQPFFPQKALVSLSKMEEILRKVSEKNHSQHEFSYSDKERIPEGMLSFSWSSDGSIRSWQFYANGLVFNVQDIRYVKDGIVTIHIGGIGMHFYHTLKITSEFYSLAGYQGGVVGEIEIEDVQSAVVRPIGTRGWEYHGDLKAGLLPKYRWNLEILDTDLLSDEKRFKDYFIEKMKEIYWWFGYEPAKDEFYQAFLKENELSISQ